MLGEHTKCTMMRMDASSSDVDTSDDRSREEPDDSEFHPTPNDIALVRCMFPLSPELVTQILDLAEYWVYSQKSRSVYYFFHHANERYLLSEPIQGGDFMYPLRRVVITTVSKHEGFHSSPANKVSPNSWNWFELTLDDGKTGNEIARVEVESIHSGREFERHQVAIDDELILKQATKGNQLCVWVRAVYPGWHSFYVRSVKIETWSAC